MRKHSETSCAYNWYTCPSFQGQLLDSWWLETRKKFVTQAQDWDTPQYSKVLLSTHYSLLTQSVLWDDELGPLHLEDSDTVASSQNLVSKKLK